MSISLLLAPLVALSGCWMPVSAQQVWTLSEETRRGEIGDDIEFGSISAVAPAGDHLYVADGMNLVIRAFDLRLRPVSELGRRGSGPGEFLSLGPIGVRADTLYAYDPRLLRLTVFTGSGDVLWTLGDVPRMGGERAPPHLHGYLAGGEVLVAGRAAYGDAGNGLHRLNPATEERVPLVHLHEDGEAHVARVEIGRVVAMVTRSVHRMDRWAVSPAGDLIVVLRQAKLPATGARVLALTPLGDTAWSVGFEPPPRPISTAGRQLLDQRVERYATRFSERGSVPYREARAAVARALDVGDHQVAFDRLVVGRKGAVLLRRGSFGLESAEWWRLVDGDLAAKFTLPSAHEIVAADGARIWSLTKGRLGEPVLVQWSAS